MSLDLVLLTLYRFIFMPMAVFLFLLLAILGHKKIRAGFRMRMPKGTHHPWRDLPKNTRPIWIHCSSGEFEYAKPVIRSIKQRHPEIPILVTYFTPSYKKFIEATPEVDMNCPLPWDLPGPIISFLKHHKPRMLLIARTDLWPEVLHQCQKMEIPSLLFSATRNKANNLESPKGWFQKWMLKKINAIFTVSDVDRLNFLDSGADVVQTKGDTRYDQVFERLSSPKDLNEILLDNPNNILTLVCGSTWPEDEDILIEATEDLIKENKLRLILAPHEPSLSHVKYLDEELSKFNLKYQLYTKNDEWLKSHVLIIDCIGILAELYQKADLSFVGGSFRSTVHSVMEPLATGTPVLVGPFYKNNREAIEFRKESLKQFPLLDSVNLVGNPREVREKILHCLEHRQRLENAKSEIIEKVKSRQGSSEKVADWVDLFLTE